MRYLFVCLTILCILLMPICADADSCPKPKVRLYITIVGNDTVSADQVNLINSIPLNLRNLNPDVEITSTQDISKLLEAQQQ